MVRIEGWKVCGAGKSVSIQVLASGKDGGGILKVPLWKRTCWVRFVLGAFPILGQFQAWPHRNGEEMCAAGQWNALLITFSSRHVWVVVTRSIFISKSFTLSIAVSSKVRDTMPSIEWLRRIEFGELPYGPTDFTILSCLRWRKGEPW